MVIIIWCLPACAPDPEAGWGIVIDPEARWVDDRLYVDTSLDLELSPAAVEALEHGVALVLLVSTRVSRRTGPFHRLREARQHRMEIKYLPLSRHWQLKDLETGQERSFPRRWILAQALAEESRRYDTGLTRGQLDDGDWRLRVRASLDRNALPPPMHLPAWLSPEWRITSAWHARRLDGDAGASGAQSLAG